MKPRALVVVLACLSMIGALSIDAYLPALPAIARQFSVSLAVAQQSLTFYLVAFAAMTLFYGTLSDSFGRRPVILVALGIYLISSLGAGCSPTLGWLLFFRLLQGLSAGAGSVIGRAMIGDLFHGPEAQRMMSYVSMVFGLAPALAPILGGWSQRFFGWRSIFFFIAIFAFSLGSVCLRSLPESLPFVQRQPFHFKVILFNYWKVASHARFMLQALGSALAFSGIMLYVSSAPAFIFDILHLGETDFAWLFVPLVGGLTLGSMTAGKISHRATSDTTILIGFLIMAVSAVGNLVYCRYQAVVLPWAVVPIAFYTFGAALISPPMMIQVLALFPKVRGLASSLQTFFFMTMFAVESGVVSPLLFGSAFSLALGAAIGVALSAGCWFAGTKLFPDEAFLEETSSPGQPIKVSG